MKHGPFRAPLPALLLLALPLGPAWSAPAAQGGTTPYVQVAQRTQDFTNFNVETTRGLALDGASLWAINTHGSQLVHFDATLGYQRSAFPTLLNPIAVAVWSDYVLVLGGATHALAFHDRTTGALVDLVDLSEDAPEPGDLVVDTDTGSGPNVAYVSSMGLARVVRINLVTRKVRGSWPVPALKPRFLYLDQGAEGPADNAVYVTPMLSGNNSTVALSPEFLEAGAIVDLDGQQQELPDEDLFRIPSGLTFGQPAQAVFRRVSTILTAHGRNPVTHQYWMLAVDLNNKDEDGLGIDTEPELRGNFSKNQLYIVPDPRTVSQLTDLGGTPAVSLDDVPVTNPPLSPADVVASNPWDLCFDPDYGIGYVSSPSGDLVRVLGQGGERLYEIATGDGSIPRSLVFLNLAPYKALFVYCWGTNQVKVFQFPSTTPLLVLDLGLDPTPPQVAAGRKIFYDADRSQDSRSTCGTCHVGGEYDGLAWPLQDRPKDHKDVMVTQNLKSIADTFPFHWRGERRLIDFNPAFVALLGGPAPLMTDPGGEFDQFQAFVFSLQSMANPHANVRRELDDLLPDGTSPANGQTAFLTVPLDGSSTCSGCHALPNGTSSEFIANPGDKASMMNFEVAHFRDLSWKDEPAVTVSFLDPYDLGPNPALTSVLRSRSGFGAGHNGNVPNFDTFAANFAPPMATQQQLDQLKDVAAFLRQFDRGISKATSKAYVIENGTSPATLAEIEDVLLDQAAAGWCDVVAMGTYPVGGVPTQLTWTYLATPQKEFHANHPSGLTATLDDFLTHAGFPELAVNAVIGVPSGMGTYLGLDFDHDGASGTQEATAGTDPFDYDSDDDGFPDGYELNHASDPLQASVLPVDNQPPALLAFTPMSVTNTVAVFRLEADEPVTYRITWWPDLDPSGAQGDYAHTIETADPALVHTVSLQGMLPRLASVVQIHRVQVEITDLSGNTTSDASITVEPTPVFDIKAPLTTTVTKLEFESGPPPLPHVGGMLTLDIRAQIKARGAILAPGFPNGGVQPDWRLIAQVLVEDVANTAEGDWVVSSNFDAMNGLGEPYHDEQYTDFYIEGAPYPGLPGDFLVSTSTDMNGETVFHFSQGGLTAGQRVALNIIAILPDSRIDTANPGPNGEPNYDLSVTDPPPQGEPPADTRSLLALYKIAATAPDKRCFIVTY